MSGRKNGSEQSLRDAATFGTDAVTPELIGCNTCTAPSMHSVPPGLHPLV